MKGYRIIEVGVLAQALTYAAYFGAVIIVLFSINYGNLYLFAAGVASAMLGLIGQRFTDMSMSLVRDRRSSEKILNISIPYVAFGLAIMGFLDAFVPRYFSVNIVGFQLYPFLSGINVNAVVQIGLVFTETEAILEEVFARGGVTNAASKITDEPMAAIIVSAVTFGLIHVPAYGLTLYPVLLGIAGGLFAVFDQKTGDLLTSMLFHMTNNAIAWAVTSSLIGIPLPNVLVGMGAHGLLCVGLVLARRRGVMPHGKN